MGAEMNVKRILPFAICGFGMLIWAIRRLNRLVFEVQRQRAQLEKLQAQTEALRATFEEQRTPLDAMSARTKASEAAILAGAKERIALWQEHLSDLDSPN